MHSRRSAFAAAALAAITCASAGAYPSTLTLKLHAENRRGETGTATLTQVSGGVNVVVRMVGAGTGAQPIHIHEGTCGNLNPAPKYPLHDVVNGGSATTVPGITLAGLLKGTYAINVHDARNDLKTYIACANIAMPKTM
jgi:hypothetical protein